MISKASYNTSKKPPTIHQVSIVQLFRNFVNCARILHAKGHPEYYRRLDRLSALDKLQSYSRYFNGRRNEAVCAIIPKLKDDLERILPVSTNRQYDTRKRQLLHLLYQCEIANKK